MNFWSIFFKRRLFQAKKQLTSLATYSRSSSSSKSPYKIVQARIKNETSNNMLVHENGANWELFGAKNNRFFLGKGSLGPAYLNNNSTFSAVTELEELIDLENKDKTKLHIHFQKCPMLIRKNLQEIFPAPEVISETSNLSLIILSQSSVSLEHEKAAIKFIFAAREICQRLRLHGFWADFLNPFSGKAFFSYHQKSLYKNDERFRGLCMKLEEIKGFGAKETCLLISEDKSAKFSGSVFTNLPSMEMYKELVLEDEIK